MADNNPDGGAPLDSFELEEKLARIRSQITSKLDNQKQLALILSAVEENIEEQKNEKTPVAYFVSFLSLLDQCIGEESILDSSLATCTAYFLDIIFPFTPKALLKSKFSVILSKLAPAITLPDADAPLIRSSIGALETLLLAQDLSQWQSGSQNVSPKRGLAGLMDLSFDPRPKVRRRAQEAVNKILSNPPPSPSSVHISSPFCSEIALTRLVELVGTRTSNKKQGNNKEINSQIIHSLQLVSAITSANAWPNSKIEALCDTLLDVSRTNDQFLVSSAFGAFEGLFNSMTNEIDNEKFSKVLNIIFDLKPSMNDTHLAAAWIAVIAKAFSSYSKLEPLVCITKLPFAFKIIATFLSSTISDIYVSASQCLIAIISNCIPENYLLLPDASNGITNEIYESVDDAISELAEFFDDLLSVHYNHCFKEILDVLTVLFQTLRSRSNPDFIKPLTIVGGWKDKESFELSSEVDQVVSAAIVSLGPDVVLSSLPLNLDQKQSNIPSRGWLLPLLRDNVRNSKLGYFKKELVPLIEYFNEKIESSPKDSEARKIFEIVVDQVWSTLPHFCDLPTDLIESFDDGFAQNLASLLFHKVDLRVTVCHALRLLVESNITYSSGALSEDLLLSQQFPVSEAQKNVEYLSTKSRQILQVLFNVFSQTAPELRGYILETIDTYFQICSKEDLKDLFDNTSVILAESLKTEAEAPHQKHGKQQTPKTSVTMMDLIVAMSKYLPESSLDALFTIFAGTLSQSDPLMQKRSYRIISKLNESDAHKASLIKYISNLEDAIIETSQTTHITARASRLSAILVIVELLPSTDLHFIASIAPEIILFTKDNNEKTRESSYKVLIQMGYKMSEGGIIQNSKLDPDMPDSEGSLNEYFTMIAGGLGAESQHMISATITALSCLIYEFKDKIDTDRLIELSSILELFLTSDSREIAKSAIGFVKIEVLSLPEELVKQNMKPLLEKLMKWSHEHKNHFKSKVKHIIERLIRKFGIDLVEAAIPEEDRKLITNIKKTRNRNKRKEQESEVEAKEETGKKSAFRSAYDEVLYDSESDEEDEEDEPKARNGKKSGKPSQFILQTEDPLDLLDRQTLSHISSSKPKKFTKKDIKSNFDSKNGKLVFKEDNQKDPLEDISGINAYIEAIKNAPVRGQKNKLKYKKQRNEDEDDMESDDEPSLPTKSKVIGKAKIGKQKPKPKYKATKKF